MKKVLFKPFKQFTKSKFYRFRFFIGAFTALIVIAVVVLSVLFLRTNPTDQTGDSDTPIKTDTSQTSSSSPAPSSTRNTSTGQTSSCDKEAAATARKKAETQKKANAEHFNTASQENDEAYNSGQISEEQWMQNRNFIFFTQHKEDHRIDETMKSELAAAGCSY